MKHETSKGDTRRGNLFKEWLLDNYEGVKVDFDKVPRTLVWPRFASGVFLQSLITIMLGTLARFHVGVPSQGAWLLIWMYGAPTLRWTRLLYNSMERKACLSLWKVGLSSGFYLLALGVGIGVYGGITVISVELFGAMCYSQISLSPGIWVLIGFAIAFAFGSAILIVFLTGVLGTRPCSCADFIANHMDKKWEKYDGEQAVL
jgi:hypothetical protein